MFGRTLRLEPATGSRKAPGSGQFGEERPRRFDSQRPNQSSSSSGGFREYSTLRATVPGFLAVRRPVGLNQVNALVGRRMLGQSELTQGVWRRHREPVNGAMR